jgi:predicted metal-dependent phosphoesterase TrpH
MKIDIHVHSRYSPLDGTYTPEEIVGHAKSIGLDGIVITDHNAIEGALEALKFATRDFTVIPGIEVSSKEGHILALGIKKPIEKRIPAKEVIEQIHSLGGIAVAAHPYDMLRGGVRDLVYNLDFDAMEILNGHVIINTKDPAKVAAEIGMPAVGGSDAHVLEEIGNIMTFVGKEPLKDISSGKARIKSKKKSEILRKYLKFKARKTMGHVGKR